MKDASLSLSTEIQKNETTLALMVRIVRKDNQEYNFTNFSSDIEYNNAVYKSSGSFIPSSFQQVSDLSVDNIEIKGYYDPVSGITERDLLLEFFYDAKIWVFLVNYKNVSHGELKLLYGSLGEARLYDTYFTIEFRNLTYKLTRKLANLFSKTCRAEFGDSKCGVILDPPTWQASTLYEIGQVVEPTIPNGRRYECISSGVSGATEPTWSTTVGDNQTEPSGPSWNIKDSIKKTTTVLMPYTYRLHIKKASDPLNIKEIKFFDSTNSRIYPGFCESDPWGSCSNTQDGSSITELNLSGFTEANIVFYFNDPGIDFKNLEIQLNSNSYIEEFELQATYDGATLYSGDNETWDTLYHFKSSAQYWDSISHTLVISDTKILVPRYKINISNPYENSDYLNNGLITWTTGLNAGFSMEIKEYDIDNYCLILFKTMPYPIKYGDEFIITAGCNHLYLGSDGTINSGDCVSKYNNGINFRGEPYVPTEDTLVGGIGETNRPGYTD